jgi:FtsH-binding integral membrane protein
MWLRGRLPEHHLSLETKDTVNLAMGFIATMAALILGFVVASAKDFYDKQSSGITQLAAKVIYLDRVLANYGPETKDVRARYRQAVERVTEQIWPDDQSRETQLDPNTSHTEDVFAAISSLKPQNDLQTALKSQATAAALELGQLRWLQYEQANSSASLAVICILVFWTAVLFASFGMYAPKNSTVLAALGLAALSVAGAILLILELRSPFTGLLQIPKTVFTDAIAHLGA